MEKSNHQSGRRRLRKGIFSNGEIYYLPIKKESPELDFPNRVNRDDFLATETSWGWVFTRRRDNGNDTSILWHDGWSRK